MSQIQNSEDNTWKTKTYVYGGAIGTIFGLLGAYLFARAAEEDAERSGGKPSKVPTMQVLSVVLTALGLIRQIAEAGKGPKKK